MTNEEIEKEIYFAEVILGATYTMQTPTLMYQEEKEVVRKALMKYIGELKDKLRDRQGGEE